MGIKVTTRGNLGDYLQKRMENYRRALIEGLIRIGEKAVTEARINHRYQNQSGNLQSSIGYCVLENGKVIFGGQNTFDIKNGREGATQGWQFIQSLISEYSSGLVLIVVAGMEYAAYVEAKNLNVLDSAEQLAEREVPRMLKDLKLNK